MGSLYKKTLQNVTLWVILKKTVKRRVIGNEALGA